MTIKSDQDLRGGDRFLIHEHVVRKLSARQTRRRKDDAVSGQNRWLTCACACVSSRYNL